MQPYLEAEAKQRQIGAGAKGKEGGRGKKKKTLGPKVTKGSRAPKVSQIIAKATGYSASTLANVTAVEDAAAAEPGVYNDLVEQLNSQVLYH